MSADVASVFEGQAVAASSPPSSGGTKDGVMFSKKGPVFKRRTKPAAVADDSTAAASTTAASLRVRRELATLEIPPGVTMDQKEDEWQEFSVTICPEAGYWKGGLFEFKFTIPAKYPWDPPRVTCLDKVYHPNIDLTGKPCINVLRPWSSAYGIQTVLFGLLFLFSHPNACDPLNQEAGEDMRKDPEQFERNVRLALSGRSVGGVSFPRNRGSGPF